MTKPMRNQLCKMKSCRAFTPDQCGSGGVSLLLAALACAALWTGCAQAPVPEQKESHAAPAVITQTSRPPQKPAEAAASLIEQAKAAEPRDPAPFEGDGWRSLLGDAATGAWREIPFGGHGELERDSGILLLNMGEPFTGVRYTNKFPTMNYEIALDAMRVMGSDFFCGLTVPVEDSHCTLVLGGWGGSLTGISSINSLDASENETTSFQDFKKLRWYRVRMRITRDRLEAWLDQDKIVDLDTSTRQLSTRAGEIELCKPLGIASWQTAGAFRHIRWRPVDTAQDPPPKRF